MSFCGINMRVHTCTTMAPSDLAERATSAFIASATFPGASNILAAGSAETSLLINVLADATSTFHRTSATILSFRVFERADEVLVIVGFFFIFRFFAARLRRNRWALDREVFPLDTQALSYAAAAASSVSKYPKWRRFPFTVNADFQRCTFRSQQTPRNFDVVRLPFLHCVAFGFVAVATGSDLTKARPASCKVVDVVPQHASDVSRTRTTSRFAA